MKDVECRSIATGANNSVQKGDEIRMECVHCGKGLPDAVQHFCPWCGQALPQPASASPPTPTGGQAPSQILSPQARQQAAAAATEAKKVAGQVVTEVQRALNDPKLRAAIPGRSLSIAGLGLMGFAILLSILPWFSGIGFFWSVIMLALGSLVAVIELRNGGSRVRGLDAIPASLLHPLLPPILAALAAIHGFLLFSIGIIPLLWAGAAGLLVYDQFQKSIQAPDSFGRYFDVRLAWYGYRKYILIGVVICLLSLFMTWSDSPSGFTGGWDYTYSYYYEGYVSSYNPTKYFWWGWDLSGRSMSFSLFAVAALVALVGWSAYRGNGSVPAWFNHLGLGLVGVAGLFWLIHLAVYLGVLLYLVGLGLIGLALAMIYQGKQTGEFDLDHLLGKQKR